MFGKATSCMLRYMQSQLSVIEILNPLYFTKKGNLKEEQFSRWADRGGPKLALDLVWIKEALSKPKQKKSKEAQDAVKTIDQYVKLCPLDLLSVNNTVQDSQGGLPQKRQQQRDSFAR